MYSQEVALNPQHHVDLNFATVACPIRRAEIKISAEVGHTSH